MTASPPTSAVLQSSVGNKVELDKQPPPLIHPVQVSRVRALLHRGAEIRCYLSICRLMAQYSVNFKNPPDEILQAKSS